MADPTLGGVHPNFCYQPVSRRDHCYDNAVCMETLAAVKDAESGIERSAGIHFGETVKAVKDVGLELSKGHANSERAQGQYFSRVLETVKDVEAGLDRAAGDRYADILKTVYQSGQESREAISDTRLEVERTEGTISRLIGSSDLESCKAFDRTRDVVQDSRKEILFNQISGFKDTQIQFKEADARAYQVAAVADRAASEHQQAILLQFKDQAITAERLACQAAKQLADCCCELKELIRGENQQTRDLINSQEVQGLREKAAKAESQLAMLQLQTSLNGGPGKN